MLSFFWIFVVFLTGGTAGILLMALLSAARNETEEPAEACRSPASIR